MFDFFDFLGILKIIKGFDLTFKVSNMLEIKYIFSTLYEEIKTFLNRDLKLILILLISSQLIFVVYKTDEIRKIGKIFNLSYFCIIADFIDKLKTHLFDSKLVGLVFTILTIFVFYKSFLVLFDNLKRFFYFSSAQYKISNFIRVVIFFSQLVLFILFLYNYPNFTFIEFSKLVGYIFFIGLLVKIPIYYERYESRNKKGFLISDKSMDITKEKERDILDYHDLAEQFAENIYNNGDPTGMIFSIEAPWGSGKTSFIDLVKKSDQIKKDCIVFEFNPWHFDSEADLLQKFLDEFRDVLIEQYDLPDLGNDFESFLSKLGDTSVGMFGVGLTIKKPARALRKIKDDINNSLRKASKKIIIIVDDIDRLPSSKIMTLFRMIDLCREFYNTNYILCFDGDNFNSIEEPLKITQGEGKVKIEESIDNSNIVKYLEKIVNVKYKLPLRIDNIKGYLIREIRNIFKDSSKDKEIGEGIESLYKLEENRIWGKYINNIRQIKRLINSLKMKMNNDDYSIIRKIDIIDLIKLQIIYLYYDNLFEDINKEIQLNYGLSGLMDNGDDDDACKFFWKDDLKFIHTYSNEEQSMIHNLFKRNKEKGVQYFKRALAVVQNDKIELIASKREDFIFRRKESFLESKSTIQETLLGTDQEYNSLGILEFLQTFEEDNITEEKARELINSILATFQRYSINSLASCTKNIVKILDNSVGRKNTPENCISTIGDYIFGRNIYKGKGVIEVFLGESWGIRGVHNVLDIRHFVGQKSSFWNFRRGVVLKEGEKDDLNKPRDFYYQNIDRYIYDLFKKNYIDKQINIFEKINELSDDDLKKEEGVIVTFGSDYTRQGLQSYIIYQFTNNKDGIGYFDTEDSGEPQKHGIKNELNDYYFDICFKGDEGIKYFMNYIFGFISNKDRFSEERKIDSEEYVLRYKNINDYTGLLDVFEEEKLLNFIKIREQDIDNFLKIKGNDMFEGFGSVEVHYSFGWSLLLKEINNVNN